MKIDKLGPSQMVKSFWQHRGLIWVLTKREVLGRYRGSVAGLFWSFLTPIFMLVVYTFVFSVVFKARWSVGSDSKLEFSLLLFAGLIVYNMFAECINRAPTTIMSNANYVKKVVFPLEILPWITIGSAIFHTLVSLLVWLLGYTIFIGIPHITTLFVPLIFLPLILLTLGLTWTLAALGVFLRDISQFIGIITTTMLFLSPVFYPISALPEKYHWFLFLNPLTPVIEQTRAVLYQGSLPNWSMMALYMVVSLIVAWTGFVIFQKTRKGFADVL